MLIDEKNKASDLNVIPLSKNTGVLLVFHGSRDENGMAEFFNFVKELRQAWDPLPVQPAFLEFVEPSILDATAEMVEKGMREILVLPFFLVAASHMKTDVPAAIHHLRARYPHVTFHYGRHLGVMPLLLSIVEQRVQELENSGGPVDRSHTGVLLVGRGSSDPDANSDIAKIARMFWEGRGFATVEIAFSGLTAPTVKGGLTRCAQLGCRRVMVIPYFLFTGVLVKRIAQHTAEFATETEGVDIRCGQHFGVHPKLIEALTIRLRELAEGPPSMSCECCKYREVLPGFESDVGAPITSDHHHGFRTKNSEASHDHGEHGHHDHGPRTNFHH